ncbi:MAG: hypothetical protein AAGA06_02160 [Pseudomonadota bacterium]
MPKSNFDRNTLKALALFALCVAGAALTKPLEAHDLNEHVTRAPLAIVTIPRPAEGRLMHLRGFAGRGTIHFRDPTGTRCRVAVTRFVAGDFGGYEGRQSGPVRIAIHNPRLVKRLQDGHDLVSGDIWTGFTVESGLPQNAGFVINPGRNALEDVFGLRMTPADCGAFRAAL